MEPNYHLGSHISARHKRLLDAIREDCPARPTMRAVFEMLIEFEARRRGLLRGKKRKDARHQ